MTTIRLRDYLAGVATRKAALGMADTAAETEAMRNKGARRTPEKRELLRRAEARATAAGKAPVASHY
jgi:hypothetical protein